MNSSDNESIEDQIEQLLHRIETLEVSLTTANERISELENQLEARAVAAEIVVDSTQEPSPVTAQRTHQNTRQCTTRNATTCHSRSQCTDRVRRDYYGDVLNPGDKVYLRTRGRNPERLGRVAGFDGQWVLITDRTGLQQRRIPRNVELRDW